MGAAKVTVTGASGLIGRALVAALCDRGSEVTVLSRDPQRARERLGNVEVHRWEATQEEAPVDALSGRDAVINLAGEPVDQRWSARVKRLIRDSRVLGTGNLRAALARAQPRPHTLLSSSAVGYYGPHGEEPLDEEAPPGSDFIARLCVEWETQAQAASELGVRVVQFRTGVVLDSDGGALAKMLPTFKLGVGGPLAGGRQYMSWVHTDDLVGLMLAALEDERWSGPVNATAPEPVCNRDFSRALGDALGRPALLPVPRLGLRLLYGEMAQMVTFGARAVPAKALVLGFQFRYAHLHEALRAVLTP